jgi:SAM-dependent methyltransferase
MNRNESSNQTLEQTYLRGVGVEIGAGDRPIPGIRPFYVDCFTSFGGMKCLADFYGHSELLPFRDNSLDFVAASHVLEHSANPVKALAEWYRVLKPGGIIYFVVPDLRFTWEKSRQPTSVAHLLEDFTRGTTACDATHIDEFADGLNWSEFSPSTPADQVEVERAKMKAGMHAAVAAGQEVNIHFHGFSPENVRELVEALRKPDAPRRFDWEIVESAERYPAIAPIGILMILRVKKTLRDRVQAWRNSARSQKDRSYPVLPTAIRFDTFREQCTEGLGGTMSAAARARSE